MFGYSSVTAAGDRQDLSRISFIQKNKGESFFPSQLLSEFWDNDIVYAEKKSQINCFALKQSKMLSLSECIGFPKLQEILIKIK